MRFEGGVKGRTRYVLDDELKAFLGEVLASCTSRRRKIKAGMHFFVRNQETRGARRKRAVSLTSPRHTLPSE